MTRRSIGAPLVIGSQVLAVSLMVLGAAFVALAGVGLLRFQDVYMRMSATSKAGTLGVMLIVLGSAGRFGDPEVLARAAATVTFFFVTAPVAAHMVGRASYATGTPRWGGTWLDERRDADEEAGAVESKNGGETAHGDRLAA